MSYRMSFTELEMTVRSMIKPSRFLHSQRVKETALELGGKYLMDETALSYISIFHDAYRNIEGREAIRICNEADMFIYPEELDNPMLLHGAVAAIKLPSFIGECPGSWALALRFHTLGSPEMGRLGAVLYIADYIEPGREYLSDEDRNEILSASSLEDMVLDILERERLYSYRINRHLSLVSEGLRHFLINGGKFD